MLTGSESFDKQISIRTGPVAINEAVGMLRRRRDDPYLDPGVPRSADNQNSATLGTKDFIHSKVHIAIQVAIQFAEINIFQINQNECAC